MKKFGLIGFPLTHSFSQNFFSQKFEKEKINASYHLYPIEDISKILTLIHENKNLYGLNVTIPYKEAVIPFLNKLDDTAKEIKAVNVIKIEREEENIKLVGYNSDIIGFQDSLEPLLNKKHKKALILGTGGAAKGVAYVLKKLNIDFSFVSRNKKDKQFTYEDLNADIINEHLLIINASPLGTFPETKVCPNIPYQYINKNHLLYDLIYNPEKTLFLQKGEIAEAQIKNGLEMLHKQALAAWKIWNK